jgi:hypothetical protein
MRGGYPHFDRDLQAIPYRHISGSHCKFMVVEFHIRDAEQARQEVQQAQEQLRPYRREKQNNSRIQDPGRKGGSVSSASGA